MRLVKEFIIIIIAVVSLVYLFLPSLLPDIVPLIGWLDEGLATTILLSALKHWGVDLTSLFSNDDKKKALPANQHDDLIVTDKSGQQTQKIRIPRAVLEQALRDYQRDQSAQK